MNNPSQIGFATIIPTPQHFDVYSRLLVEIIIFFAWRVNRRTSLANLIIAQIPLAQPVPQGWSTPANVKNGLHQAITDEEIITIRLGAMGVFER